MRHLLIEYGRAEAYLYNQYLQTGDEWYINHTNPGFKRSKEFFSGWKKLYEHNLGLESSKKLWVYGIDFEREPGLSASLYKLLSTYENTPQIKKLMDAMKTRLDTIGIQRRNKTYVHDLREQINRLSLPEDGNKKIIEEIISNDYFYVNSVGTERDMYMARNFIALDTINEHYLGQFGFAHTFLNNEKFLTGYLNSIEKYHNKILVINMHYINAGDINPFENVSPCSVFLYSIDPSDYKLSLFKKRGQWVLVLKDQQVYTREE